MKRLAPTPRGSFLAVVVATFSATVGYAAPSIRYNALGYETKAPKVAVAQDAKAPGVTDFDLLDASNKSVFTAKAGSTQEVPGWTGMKFQTLDFSAVTDTGIFTLRVQPSGTTSDTFRIGTARLFRTGAKAVVGFFNAMRNTSADDHAIPYFNQPTRGKHDVYGGWRDATGDDGKYLSHLSYANFMNPQQIPMVVWSLLRSQEMAGFRGEDIPFSSEALWGADYLLRVQDPVGYFYINVFNAQWKGDRTICAWIGYDTAQGFPTSDYQAAWREGGGMSIAALALASRTGSSGDSTSAQYLAGAKRGFAHLASGKGKWADDGRENLIDHTTALMAAIELGLATSDPAYLIAAQERVDSVLARQQPQGWFYVDTGARPWYHGVDEGLPMVALARYLAIDSTSTYATRVRTALSASLAWYKAIGHEVANPFDYPRMYVPATPSTLPGVGSISKGMNASSSSVQGTGQEASKAFDGDAVSRWSAQAQDSLGWIAVDLGRNYLIDSVALVWEAAYAKKYDIQISSDSLKWTTAVTEGATAAGRRTTTLANHPSARYVRMKGATRASPYYSYSIYEFEVYGRDDAPVQTPQPGKTAFFMPHQNESRYWWQGENARLGSMATAFVLASQAVDPAWRLTAQDTISRMATAALEWVGGANPFGITFLHGFGPKNPASYMNGTNLAGGICNGITASRDDLTTPQFSPDADGAWTNWRWVEQWLPHDSWYLLGISAIAFAQERSIDIAVQPRHPARQNLSIRRGGSGWLIEAPNATRIELHGLDGRLVASTHGTELRWSGLGEGVILVTAQGNGWSLTRPISSMR